MDLLQLNRATLARQMLLRRERVTVNDALGRVLALQAQDPAAPYVALWSRIEGFDPVELDRAFATAAVVKATLLRITLHAVRASDHELLHVAMQPTLRAARLRDKRFASTGLDADEADALVPDLLAFASEPRANADVEAWLDGRLDVDPKWVWWALRHYAPLRHAPADEPWTFGARPRYLAAAEGPRSQDPADTLPALAWLLRRYVAAFGPASVADMGRFALVQRGRVRQALALLDGELVELDGDDGRTLLDLPDAPRPAADTPAPPRLLAMWDSVLLAHDDRRRIIADEHRPLVVRRNGDTLPTLLVDGRVAGIWRATEAGVEATVFHPLADRDWAGLATEAASVRALLAARDPHPWSRYHRWWDRLPSGLETRLLA